jgi:ATP-dependent exoDNAse (exonuclease V) beta subunit
VCLDEFQDTDPLQVEIAMLLCADDPEEVDSARICPSRGKLFVVGDPKQSIYRFRRADVRLYEQTRRRLVESGAVPLQLETSFRSQPRIQAAVNGAFVRRMTGSLDGSQATYVPLAGYRDDVADQPAVIALPVPRPYGKYGKVYKRAIEDSLPDAVGAYVEWLVNESGWKVTEREDPTRLVPLKARHVCLLFRRFQSWRDDVTRPYVRALEAREIPHVLVGGRSYFDREEVLAVRNALTAIEWPDDRLSVYGALRGPLMSLGDGTLLHFTSEVGPLHPLRPFGSGNLR